jgi:hypothetical protein
MPDFNTSIEIEPWEYVSECSKRDIEDLIETLINDGHLDTFNGKVKPSNSNTLMDDKWNDTLEKLRNSRHLLSIEEENRITEIGEKFI